MDGTRRSFDLEAIRADFPILSREVHGKPLVYLDSAASAQKPAQVLGALMSAYQDTYANVHRGLHFLSEASTDLYEAVRGKVAGFIGAASGDEIVLTPGATMSLNLIARCWAQPRLQPGDEILIRTPMPMCIGGCISCRKPRPTCMRRCAARWPASSAPRRVTRSS